MTSTPVMQRVQNLSMQIGRWQMADVGTAGYEGPLLLSLCAAAILRLNAAGVARTHPYSIDIKTRSCNTEELHRPL